MIDTHCHFDMMPNPEKYILEMESKGHVVIGMTNTPDHFRIGLKHIKNYKYIRLALGFHPLLVTELQEELEEFKHFINSTSYIGEIGLDFSKTGIMTKDIQVESLRYILSCLQNKNKLISVHSRGAEESLLNLLQEYNIKNVIFHWYSGKTTLIPQIVSCGYYFSINESMTLSKAGRDVIAAIPIDKLLTETDAPYNTKCNIESVKMYLSKINSCSLHKIETVIQNNFSHMVQYISKKQEFI